MFHEVCFTKFDLFTLLFFYRFRLVSRRSCIVTFIPAFSKFHKETGKRYVLLPLLDSINEISGVPVQLEQVKG